MINVQVATTNALDTKTSLLAITTSEYEKRVPNFLEAFDAISGGQLSAALADFTGKAGQSLLCYTHGRAPRLFVIGLGEKRKVDAEMVRRAAGKAAGKAQSLKCPEMAFVLPSEMHVDNAAYAATEGILLGGYVFNRYQTIEPKPANLKQATLLTSSKNRVAAAKAVGRASEVVWGTMAVRDMVNTPASDWAPESFAETAVNWGKEYGYKVEVKGPAELRKEGFGGILAVGGGSANTPRFVRMDYRRGKGDPIVLVGKGITFDTGGISIKPAADMDQMKGDMMGAAVVLATLTVAARLKLKVNLTGLICSAENMPSSTAYRPGDVVKTYGGKTIEVLNTDAEGRVVLADGLGYGSALKPRAMIDLATLTGAIIIALGHHTAGVFGTNQKLIDDLVKSGKRVSEPMWQLPLNEEHDELVKSEIADVKNSSGRPAASSAAAAFLKTFTDGTPWAHMDIAGVDLEFKGLDYVPKGATGFGVRLLIDYLSRQAT